MKIETKYNINQAVWFIEGGKVVEDTILKIEYTINNKSEEEIKYWFENGMDFGYRGSYYRVFNESQVFATKEEYKTVSYRAKK